MINIKIKIKEANWQQLMVTCPNLFTMDVLIQTLKWTLFTKGSVCIHMYPFRKMDSGFQAGDIHNSCLLAVLTNRNVFK